MAENQHEGDHEQPGEDPENETGFRRVTVADTDKSPEFRTARDTLVDSIEELYDGFKLGRAKTVGNWKLTKIPENRGGGDRIEYEGGKRRVSVVFKPVLIQFYRDTGYQPSDESGGVAHVEESRYESGDVEQMGFTINGDGEVIHNYRSVETADSGHRLHTSTRTEDPFILEQGTRFVAGLAEDLISPPQ